MTQTIIVTRAPWHRTVHALPDCFACVAEDEPFRTKEQTAAALKAKQAVAHIDYEAMGSEVDQLREESVAALARCKAAKVVAFPELLQACI